MTNDNERDAKSPPTILVVDDTPANLNLLLRHLQHAGFGIIMADNGLDALREAEQVQPDLILLDIMMPEMDGYETCRRLKANEATQDIPIIFMTALSEVNDKIRAFTVGGVDYVTKPFEEEELLVRIETHLTLRRLQQTLEREISEREKTESTLRHYAQELQHRNQELDAFAHTVAHNLKNSLGIITGTAEALIEQRQTLSGADLKHYLRLIQRSGQKAQEIVEALLILAKVREQEIKTGPLAMARIVAEAQERLAGMIAETQAEIILPAQWPTALGYAPWVEEVWVNYLSNGLKYGGDPPKLELGGTEETEGMARFWVKDNGPGLSAQEQDQLFAPFTRLNASKAPGEGLGLSIVHRIVEKLGGNVNVVSPGLPGQGTTFSFTLPLASAQK